MSASRAHSVLAGLALAGVLVSGCAGPRVLTTLSPEAGAVPAGKTLALLTLAEAAGAAAGLAQGRIAGRAPAAGQAPDLYLQVGDSARPGAVGVLGPAGAASAPPAWIETARPKRLFGGKAPVRMVEVAVIDARSGARLALASAADRKPGDRQPLSALVDAALARLGLVPPAS